MYRIGIDLGGTNIAAAIVDKNFKIVKKASVPTLAQRAPDYIVDDMAALCHSLCAEAEIDESDIEAIGIAAPGIANHVDGILEYTCNMTFRNYPICDELKKRFHVETVHVENDANAAAWGEAIAGAAKGTSNSVMITLGTGVGGGVIIDNKVYSGFNFAGAELGHVVIMAGGRPCNCGRKGCWETYSSATALINMTNEKIKECSATGRETAMTAWVEKKGKVSGRTAFDCYKAGDAAASEVIDKYIYYLACGITSMVTLFQPEVLSIGGGISGEGQALIDLIEPLVNAERFGGKYITRQTDIRIAQLGNDAGIIGAACLGI